MLEPESVMWVWVVFYFGFLVWRVSIRTHRALLPIIPFLLIAAAHAIGQVIEYAAARLPRRLAVVLTIASVLVIVGFELPGSLGRSVEFRQTTSQREQTSKAVLAGYWLAEHYPPSARILYDPYSYVPPSFTDAQVTPWGGTLQILETLKPDVVITNEYSSGLFSDIHRASTYARDEAYFVSKHEYYDALQEGKTGYKLIRDFDDVQIYARQ